MLVNKAAGEESYFRGGDPELAQQKREEKKQEMEEAGELDSGDEESADIPSSEDAAEAEAKEEEKSYQKAFPVVASEAAPVDSVGDFQARNANGDLIANQPTLPFKNIEICPPRCGKNQNKRWSDVLGFKIPLEGNPWFYLRRFAFGRDPTEGEKAKEEMYMSINSDFSKHYVEMSDLAKSGLFTVLVSNYGLLFRPECFISKAIKGEALPNHRYIHRYWDGNKWNYEYTEGVHPNHGIEYSGSRQGSTIETNPDWHNLDKQHENPEGGFHFSRQATLKSPYVGRVHLTDPNTNETKPFVFVTRPTNQNKPIELHADEGKELKHRNFKTKNALSRLTSMDNWDKFLRAHTVNTELGPNGKPYLYWREREGKRPFVKFDENSPYTHSGRPSGWSRPFHSVDQIREHLKKVHELASRGDVASKKDVIPREIEPGKEWTGKVENGHFLGKIGRTTKKLVGGGAERKQHGKYGYMSQYETSREVPEVNWESPQERKDFTHNLFKEHHGLFVKIADSLVRDLNEKRVSQGKMPISGAQKSAVISRLVTDSFPSIEHTVASYDPRKTFKNPKSGESNPARFSTYLYHKARSAQRQALPHHVKDVTGEGASRVDPTKIFSKYASHVPARLADEHTSYQEASQETPDFSHENPEKYKSRVKKVLEQHYNDLFTKLKNNPELASHLKNKIEQANQDLNSVKSNEDALNFHDKWTSPITGVHEHFVPPVGVNESEVNKKVEGLKRNKHQERLLRNEFGRGRLHSDVSSLINKIPEEYRDVAMPSKQVLDRIKGEKVKTLRDLLQSYSNNPPQTRRERASLANFVRWVKNSPQLSNEHGPVPTIAKKALMVVDLLKATNQEEDQYPNVNYIGKTDDKEHPRFMYEMGDGGNIVYGTNAPEGHPEYEETLGDPVVSPNEPNPEEHPYAFDEQGNKLDRPIPEGVEVENNPNYDPDRNQGNFWAKRYMNPDNNSMEYIYYHRDQVLDPRLRVNNKIKIFLSQLPKIREWYKTWFNDNSEFNRTVALFTSLLDQGKLSFEDLPDLKVENVELDDEKSSVRFHFDDGRQIELQLDSTPFAVMSDLIKDKDPSDFVFEVDGNKLDGQTYAKILSDHFGVLPSYFKMFHVTELFSKEFGKIIGNERFDIGDVDGKVKQALSNVSQMICSPEEGIESYLDPIVVEALIISSHVKHGDEVNKSYKLAGRIEFRGLPVSLENKKGSVRKWYDPHEDKHGETKMHYDYGYIRRTEGTDGDHVDVYIGPNENAERVYVIHQMKSPKFDRYDEDKCMLGFNSAKEAKDAYIKQYDSPKFFGSMTEMLFEDFKNKVNNPKNRGKMLKSWRVASDPRDVEGDEESFAKWMHSYPLHEHYYHWSALRDHLVDNENKRLSNSGGLLANPKTPLADSMLFPNDVKEEQEVSL